MTTVLIGLCWVLASGGLICLGRASYWRRQWDTLGATQARTLDQLAATQEALRTLPPPIERPRTKAPQDLPLIERIWWDLHEYERTGWWDPRLAWRVHPDDAELVSSQLHTWRARHSDTRPPPLGLHIMGTPLLVDPNVPRYDAVGYRSSATVQRLPAAPTPGLVPPRGTRFTGPAAARQPVPRVPQAGGLGPPGAAPGRGRDEGGPRIDPAVVAATSGAVPEVPPTDVLR